MELEFSTFVRKPFVVEAVRITEENIEEVAPFVGQLMQKPDDSTHYIEVDPEKVPNLSRVYPGFWLTRLGKNLRCYSNKIFRDQFTEETPDIRQWADFARGIREPQSVNSGG